MNPKPNPSDDLLAFSGPVPIFPLPNCVLYPQIVQPMHIFEPRYRAMTADCLDGDQLMVLALLKPGWETQYETKTAPIYPVGCLSRITVSQTLPDGRYILVVRGIARVEIQDEIDTPNPYRVGEAIVHPDQYAPKPRVNRSRRRNELLQRFFENHPELARHETLGPLLREELALGALCDLLAYSSNLCPVEAWRILQEYDVDARSDRVLQALIERSGQHDVRGRVFPPEFSMN